MNINFIIKNKNIIKLTLLIANIPWIFIYSNYQIPSGKQIHYVTHQNLVIRQFIKMKMLK